MGLPSVPKLQPANKWYSRDLRSAHPHLCVVAAERPSAEVRSTSEFWSSLSRYINLARRDRIAALSISILNAVLTFADIETSNCHSTLDDARFPSIYATGRGGSRLRQACRISNSKPPFSSRTGVTRRRISLSRSSRLTLPGSDPWVSSLHHWAARPRTLTRFRRLLDSASQPTRDISTPGRLFLSQRAVLGGSSTLTTLTNLCLPGFFPSLRLVPQIARLWSSHCSATAVLCRVLNTTYSWRSWCSG